MQMYFSILKDALKDMAIEINTVLSSEPGFRHFKFYSGQTKLSDESLYFVTQEQLSSCNWEVLPLNIVVVGGLPEDMQLEERHIMMIHSDLSELSVFSAIQDVFITYSQWSEQLMDAIIARADIVDVLDLCAEKLYNPIALHDLNTSLIEWAGIFSGDYTGSIWENVIRDGYSYNYHSYSEQSRIVQKINQSTFPFLHYSVKRPNITMLSVGIRYKGRVIASLGSTDVNLPFTDGQIRLVDIIKQHLESYFACHFIQYGMIDSTPKYLDCLLCGEPVEVSLVEKQLKRYRWNLCGKFRVLLFRCMIHSDANMLEMEMYIRILRDKFQGDILFSHDSDIVLIINFEKNDIDYEERKRICGEFYQIFKLQCGISEEFYAFIHIHHYYNQCLIALMEGSKCHPEHPSYAFRDYYRHKLVQCIEESVDIKAFCHPSMLQILEEKTRMI